MKEVTYYEFCKTIAEDNKIEFMQKHKTYKKQFPINKKNGNRKISSSYDSIIVDSNGNEFPYMLNTSNRNNEKLIDFDYIYVVRHKDLNQICKEADISLKFKKCRICEGGGWTSEGFKYFYNGISCEF